jgi:hypothetical protein
MLLDDARFILNSGENGIEVGPVLRIFFRH